MTVWALSEAQRPHYPVAPEFLAEMEQWTKERFLAGLEKPRDPRPGFNMINTSALYLAVMAQNHPDQKTLSAGERQQIAGHAARHLEEDGSVLTPATMTPPMAKNGPPPVFESREVLTLFAVMAMQPREAGEAGEPSAVGDARKRAGAYLAAIPTGEGTQAAALRLLLAVRERKPRRAIHTAAADLLKRQNPDGGWGQLPQLPSDAYATGQTLYVLSLAGVDRDRKEIRRAVAFLAANQREDGSWPMTPRAHPGATPMTNPNPIGHIGSCWAVIGLARSVPAPRAR
jgi:hypothetical protein